MKYTLIALVAVLCLATFAMAIPPPANDGYAAGWGMNPTRWQTATGTFSAWGIYDPLFNNPPNGGAPWVIGYNGVMPVYITYAPITLQLWIEMYALQTYQYTSYQWHRLGNLAETICFDITGTCQSNNGQYISLMKGADGLDKLWFRHNIFGGQSPTPPAIDLAITWTGSWGRGLVYGVSPTWSGVLVPSPNDLTMLLEDVPFDHWFGFNGCFSIPYNQPDGYYSLTMAGCPAPVL